MPIRVFIDHGDPSPEAETTVPETNAAFSAYSMLRRGGQHLQPAPGDRLPLNDLEVTVVSSAGTTLFGPLPAAGAITTACQEHALSICQALPHGPGLDDVWQLLQFDDAGYNNCAQQYVANLDETTSHWIKLTAKKDGSFRVFNDRTGEWTRYTPRSQ